MNRFLKGAMILTLAGIIVKVIGAFSKVLIARILGGEGIGLYMMAYPIVPPVHPGLYTTLYCVLGKQKTHNICFLERWSIFAKLGIGEVDDQCFCIFRNI